MDIPSEHAQEFARFPFVLQELVKAELAAGSSIVEFCSGHPAWPVGANLRLAKPVSTRPRESDDAIQFRARNNSDHAGEFTDTTGCFYVIEPPLPPPTDPAMDAIRAAAQVTADTLNIMVQERLTTGNNIAKTVAPRPIRNPLADGKEQRGLSITETPTGVTRVLHFQDQRPPHEIEFMLERYLMVLFEPAMANGHLVMKAKASVNGAPYDFALRFEAALPHINCYSLRIETSWAEKAEPDTEYFRKTSASWFGFWTSDFKGADPPATNARSPARYQNQCDEALQAESQLTTIPAVQQAIVAAMKQGALFTTSCKEGDTNIYWQSGSGNFALTDSGDYPAHRKFTSEEEFLTSLRMFYDFGTSQNIYPAKATDFVAWKLILRLLRTNR